jgi:antitoxin component YwqK of YwqJK toxin-antitoxin module
MPTAKNNLILTAISLLLSITSVAQTSQRRNVRFVNVGKDSVKLTLNEEYYLIEDSCAQIIRYARFDFKQRLFTGKFKDVNHVNPEQIIATGEYNDKGLKNGEFISYYLNSNLQAKGSFKENRFTGKWDLFYEDGKPKLSFVASENEIQIVAAWDAEGKKIVDNGKGTYKANLGNIYWTGRLTDGKPDGKWKAIKTNDRTNTELVTESFKNGVFQKGDGPTGDYNDASRILLVSEIELPFANAEKLRISSVPCNGVKRKLLVNAQYRNGFASFSEEIKRLVTPYLGKVDLRPFDTEVTFSGEVSETGDISLTNYTAGIDDKIASGLQRELRALPRLEPALADGKPIVQKFTIIFRFSQGLYSFSYRFLPPASN